MIEVKTVLGGDDMSDDLKPHGSREHVADALMADNQQDLQARLRLRHIR